VSGNGTSGIPTAEEDFLPLSGIQHFVYCERQAALIHVEGVFVENHLTIEGKLLHAPVDTADRRARDDIEVESGVWLCSRRLGLVGRADRIEVIREGGAVRLFPVESKRARRRSFDADCVQLCAQAMALEEASNTQVPRGALYYIRARRRVVVEFTEVLRVRTLDVARQFHQLAKGRVVPRAHHDGHCRDCSLRQMCLPRVTEQSISLNGYLARVAHEECRDA
jgi:CRISPR-associated exonuclease Cas4